MKKENLVHIFDWDEMAKVSRQAVAEGCVLIKNDNKTLPIQKGEKVALFGRGQFNYYKSGTGSGGAVNTPYVIGILEAMKSADENADIVLDKEVLGVYEEWIKDNPFDAGVGWASEPWNQKEMIPDEDMVKKAAETNDIAVFIIARTAGEDKDNRVAAGSYLLTDREEQALELVTKHFDRVAVLLNTGNIIDMKWMDIFNPSAVMYVWQGGMVGGDGVVDVLLGRVNPSGRLADTIAEYMKDYPSSANFGSAECDLYAEDIYVGYRYFETFAKDKVIYPFGYGLSYTTFDILDKGVIAEENELIFNFEVKNTGEVAGAQVVQLYLSKPQGKLGNPARELVGFAKTQVIEPGLTDKVSIVVTQDKLASYDDSGVTGYRFSYVVEAGDYNFYAGENVRNAKCVYSMTFVNTAQVKEVGSALAPLREFERMRPVADGDTFKVEYEPVPTRSYDIKERIAANRPTCAEYTGDKGIKLADVQDGKASMEEFLAQLSDEDLIVLTRGEGMCSPKATPGTAAAFGGVTDELADFGLPIGCCADGPSGIRMDCGTYAFSMPNGTSMACSFNLPLIEKLYEYEGMDLRRNQVDLLLGPGINMHRNPLNGRNFEYFSEDPYLTGIMAATQLRGLASQGVSGTIKHFAGNEQESHRYDCDSVVSERALREIYLKPFEMAVKEGGAYSIMTTYGCLNGQWTAGNYDLVTTILRNEWGFEGIAMTDWWAQINEEGEAPSKSNTIPMVRAQNDLYMVVTNAIENTGEDNTAEGLADGRLTRGELVRNAANVCRVLMKSPCMKRFVTGTSETWQEIGLPEGAVETISWTKEIYVDHEGEYDLLDMPTDKGCVDELQISFKEKGFYRMYFDMSSTASEIAQMPVSIFNGANLLGTISIHGTGGLIETRDLELVAEVVLAVNLKFKFGLSGVKMHRVRIEFEKESGLK